MTSDFDFGCGLCFRLRSLSPRTLMLLAAVTSTAGSASGQSPIPTILLTAPELQITSASSGFELTEVGSVAGAVLARANGDLLVSQFRTSQLVVFDRAGKLKSVVGRQGQGPGEFLSLDGLGEFGDTIWVQDARQNRFSFFASDYKFLRTLTPVRSWGQPGSTNIVGLLVGGTAYGIRPAAAPARGTPTREREDTQGTPIAVARYDGTDPRVVAFQARRTFSPSLRVGRRNLTLGSDAFRDFSFLGASPESDRIVLLERPLPTNGRQSSYVVTTVRANGDTAWRRSIAYTPQPTSAALVDSVRSWLTAEVSKQAADSVIDVLPRFASPVIGMVVGAGGIVWVGERAARPDQTTWRLLDAEGVDRVRVTLDTRHRVIAARGEDLWTVSLDADDVPVLNRFRVPSVR